MELDATTDERLADLAERVDELDRRLREQQQAYEARLSRLEAEWTPPVAAMPPPPPVGAVQLPPPGRPPASQPAPTPRPPRDSISPDWEIVIRWAGIMLVALAAIFLVSTSISRGWIGPNLQLAGATLGGLSLLGGAVYFASKLRVWAVSLGIGGAIVLPVCAAAAHGWLDLVSRDVSLVLVAAATAISVGVAYFTRLDEVSLVAVVGGMLVPISFGFFEIDNIALLTWWTASGAVIAASLGWASKSTLVRVGGVVTSAVVLLVTGAVTVDRGIDALSDALLPVAIIAAAMWIGPAVADRIGGHRWTAFDYWTVALTPGFAWTAAIFMRSRGEESPWFDAGQLGLIIAVGFLLALVASFRYLPRALAVSHFLGAGALITASLVAMADGPMLVVALTAQAVFTFVLSQYFDDRVTEVCAGVLGVATVALTGFGILDGIFNDGASLGEALAHLLVIALLAGLAMFLTTVGSREFSVGCALASWVGALGWTASVLLNVPQGQAAISIVWALMAAGATIAGMALRSSTIRTTGLVTLTVVVAKLLSVDLSEVDVFWRVGVFFVVGAGLLRLAYVLPRYGSDDPAPA